MKQLSKKFTPKLISLNLTDEEAALLGNVEQELHTCAQKDAHKCWGYFPALAEKNLGLVESKRFHQIRPELYVEGKKLELNFIRISLIQQTGSSPYHMDSDSKTALTGDTSTIGSRLVWRLLVNLSSKHIRTLGYLDINTETVELTAEGGYIHYVGQTKQHEKSIIIPPRVKGKVSGVLFCASRVLHTGKDDQHGHFVAGFGCEETI